MISTLTGVEPTHADAIASAVLAELLPYGIDDSRVELSGRAEPAARVLSVEVAIDGHSSAPLLIETGNFKASLEAQRDLLRAWLGSGHPAQIATVQSVQYKAGQRVPAPDATGPVVAVRDSRNSRVWVVSEHAAKDPSAEAVPYLIYPDGSLVKEQQHGLPD